MLAFIAGIILITGLSYFGWTWTHPSHQEPVAFRPSLAEFGSSSVSLPDSSLENCGSLTVFTGPMFCEKTTRLLREITRYADTTSLFSQLQRPLLVNSQVDSRDLSHVVSSHSSAYKGLSEKIDVISARTLTEVDISGRVVIGIDEAQFFPDLVEVVKNWLAMGKHIYCAGLDSDRNMNPFGHIAELLHLSDSFTKFNSVCYRCLEEKRGGCLTPADLKPAPFTACLQDKTPEQVQVGGSDIYRPVCRRHFFQRS